MQTVTCQNVENAAQDLLDRRAPIVLSGELRKHVESCEDCSVFLAGMNKISVWSMHAARSCVEGNLSIASGALAGGWRETVGRLAFVAAASIGACIAWFSHPSTWKDGAIKNAPTVAQAAPKANTQEGQNAPLNLVDSTPFRTAAISGRFSALASDPNLLLQPVRFGLTPVSESITSAINIIRRSRTTGLDSGEEPNSKGAHAIPNASPANLAA